jgi:outer membrane lipoprotein-sorting protein
MVVALMPLLASAVFGKSHPKPLPNPWMLIEKSLSGSPYPYRGKLTTLFSAEPVAKTYQTVVSFSPPDLYRREILDSNGKVKEVAISNGQREWIYDKVSHKYWEMTAPSKPDEGKEIARLRANYQVVASGFERAAGRRAFKVELRSKKDHALARVLWFDPKYGVVLKSRIFNARNALVSETTFQKIRFFLKTPANPKWFSFQPPKKATPAKENLDASLEQAKARAKITPLTPSWLPFGYALEKVQALSQKGQIVIQEEFSDGINAISLFEYPKSTALKAEGNSSEIISLSSGKGQIHWTSEGAVLDWSHGNLQLVLVGALEEEIILRIAESIK